jgi:SAM-dependent methyltransferase
VGINDRKLRDKIYNSSLGKIYNFIMPLLMIPVRPMKVSRKQWLVYSIIVFLLVFSIYQVVEWIGFQGITDPQLSDIIFLILLLIFVLLFIKKPNYLYLILFAVPVKISLSRKNFRPEKSHGAVHAEFQEEYKSSDHKLKILDVATGSGNSLYRHGWMKLNADYTGVDLSEKMILQAQEFMSGKGIPVDFMICDATKLPFKSETFDIVTSYGAVNAYNDPKTALEEMVRVTKKGGKILFLDEQEYEESNWFEHMYFKNVLTYHNTIVGCPVELLPEEMEEVRVFQVYEFIYVCVGRKGSRESGSLEFGIGSLE